MKRAEAIALGVPESVIDEGDLDIAHLVVCHEFGKKRGIDGTQTGYRIRALDRLVDMRVPFSTDSNIDGYAVKRYLKAQCPYCTKEMHTTKGGGNSDYTTYKFVCDCSAEILVSLPTEHALTVRPPTTREPT